MFGIYDMKYRCVAVAVFWLSSAAYGASAQLPATAHYDATKNSTDQPNISGVWLIKDYVPNTRPQGERLLKTMDGARPPLQDWAAKLYYQRADDADAGRPYAPTSAQCLPPGMPAMMLGPPYPFQIVQSPGLVLTVHMEEHAFRFIYLGETLPSDPDPIFMGYSVGRWEGDTLLVDTVGLTDRTTLDFSGLPHTDQLRVHERIHRVNHDTLEDVLTFDDPGAYTKPWSIRRMYALQGPAERIQEYVCETQHNPVDASGHSTYSVKP